MSKLKVAVIFGGVSSEHEVSLVSATHIIQNIPKDKYEVVCIGITKKGRWLYFPGDVKLIATGEWDKHPDCVPAVLSPDPIHHGFIKFSGGGCSVQKVDVIFPALHGKNGEDGTIQGLFELAAIPYVGCGVLSSADCMDKEITHTILDANGIRTAKFCTVHRSDLSHLNKRCEEIAEKLGFPLFVKPANCGSSVGINKAHTIEDLSDAIKYAFTHDKKVIVEEFIKGKEIECAVFGNDTPIASIPGEIVPSKEFYDYEDKYILGSTQLFIPARIEDKYSDKIRETAVAAYKALGCSGLTRVDFFFTDKNEIVLNEPNTLPGFTPISMYPKLMAATGMPYSELIDNLIKLACEKAEINVE